MGKLSNHGRSALTLREVAELLGISKQLLYSWYDRGSSHIEIGSTRLPVRRVGHRLVVSRAEMERFLSELATTA